jgi:hypothetical protein
MAEEKVIFSTVTHDGKCTACKKAHPIRETMERMEISLTEDMFYLFLTVSLLLFMPALKCMPTEDGDS